MFSNVGHVPPDPRGSASGSGSIQGPTT